jgi:hypothetical protein
VRSLAWGAVGAHFAIGLLLIARRAAGALTADLPAAQLLAAASVAAAIVIASRVAWVQRGVATAFRERRAFAWVGTAALWVVCLGCAPPNQGAPAWLLWLPYAIADHVSRRAFLARGGTHAPRAHSATPSAPDAPPLQSVEGPGDPPGRVLQSLTRTLSPDGVEKIAGTLRAEFAVGQRHATLYVGFCPPLERLPQIEIEQVDGPDAAVTVVQGLAHGARVEVRLAEPADEPCHVIVEFCAAPADE